MANFINLSTDYLNLDQIARVEFRSENGRNTAIVYFAKPGGSDKHIVTIPDDVKKLRDCLDSKPCCKA